MENAMLKWFGKLIQSQILKTSYHICNYYGRHLPASAVKDTGEYFICVDSDDCLDFQDKQPECSNNKSVQEDGEYKSNFEDLSLKEILAFIQSDELAKIGTRSASNLCSRLLDFAFLERDVSDEDQQKALLLYEALIKDTKTALAHDENGLAALEELQQTQFEYIRNFGRGSLSWEISTPGLTNDEIYSIVINPENSHKINRFIKNFSETWAILKPGVIKKIIRERRRNGEGNAVLIAAGLITGTDPVAWNIFTPSERNHLQNVALDYDAARRVLTSYKILPEASKALPFEPRIDRDLIADIALMSLNDDDKSPWNDNKLKTCDEFNTDQQNGIGAVLIGLRMVIWLEIIEGLYGIDFAHQIEHSITSALNNSLEAGLTHVIDKIRKAKQESLKNDATSGWDTIIATNLMEAYMLYDDSISEETNKNSFRKVITIYSEERVYWMVWIRGMIRHVVNDIEKRKDEFELTEIEHEIYMTFGAIASNIEAKSLYEDWIGTSD